MLQIGDLSSTGWEFVAVTLVSGIIMCVAAKAIEVMLRRRYREHRRDGVGGAGAYSLQVPRWVAPTHSFLVIFSPFLVSIWALYSLGLLYAVAAYLIWAWGIQRQGFSLEHLVLKAETDRIVRATEWAHIISMHDRSKTKERLMQHLSYVRSSRAGSPRFSDDEVRQILIGLAEGSDEAAEAAKSILEHSEETGLNE